MQDPTPISLRFKGGGAARAAVLLLLLGLVSTFTQAKYGQYFAKSKTSSFATKTLKITRDGSVQRKVSRKTLPRPSTPFVPRFAVIKTVPRQPEVPIQTVSAYLSANQLRSPPRFTPFA